MATRLRYKYPSWENWVYFDSPDGNAIIYTTVSPVPGGCDTIYDVYIAGRRLCYYFKPFIFRPDIVFGCDSYPFAAQFYGPIGGYQLIYESDSLGNTVRGYRLLCRGLVSPGSQPAAVPFWFENRFNKLHVPYGLDIIPVAGQTDDCGCKLIIKYEVTGEVLYEQVDAVCPEVEYIEGCPPETVCECNCGDMTCCWDANGIPIFSFPN